MSRPVSLSVHRNNRAQREAKRIRSALKVDAKTLASWPGLAGYAVVVWDHDRNSKAEWFVPGSGPIPASVMPEHVKITLLRLIAQRDTRDILDSPIDDGAA